MFESLGDRLQTAIHKIKGYGKITEQNIDEIAREIRLALLEADVNYQVVKEFTNNVKEKALGLEVSKNLRPDELFIKLVKDELIELLGGEASSLETKYNPTILMLVGLQGSGKTTTAGKLANLLRKKYNRKLLMVAADVYRPAAIDQLQTLGKQLDVPVFSLGSQVSPVQIASQAIEKSREELLDTVIIDTAGRLHIDENLMDELKQIKEAVHPDEILLVVDAMTGQDAVNVAQSFHDQLGLTGVVLTKLDGDTRGGAALSIRQVTDTPIKFIGVGEKLDGLEIFHPERMAQRILGMGDVLSLIEKAQDAVDQEKALEMQKKMRTNEITLQDFLDQLAQVRKLGPIQDIMKMMPGMNKMKGLDKVHIDDKQIKHIEAIIQSMTPAEKENPSILNAKRKQRIAKGSGRSVPEVNRLLKQFEDMKKMMKMMSGMGGKKGKKKGMKGFKGMKFPF